MDISLCIAIRVYWIATVLHGKAQTEAMRANQQKTIDDVSTNHRYEHHAHGYAHRRYLSCQNYWLDLMWMCDFQGKRTQIVCVFDAIWHLARLYYLCFITGSSVTDFEYTPEMSCFDLLDMDLRHGWLLDPQDRETVHLVQLYFVCRMWFKGPWFHVSHFGCLT